VKHGWDAFDIEILEILENFNKKDPEHKRLILEKESHYISLFDTTDRSKGYNRCKFSNDRTGTVCSDETKEKMRKAATGRKRAPFTEEHKKRMSMGSGGKPLSEEHKAKIRAGNLGKKRSEETKRKLKRPKSEEHKAKLRESRLGVRLTEDQKIKRNNKMNARNFEDSVSD
jgi:hypothetical protein